MPDVDDFRDRFFPIDTDGFGDGDANSRPAGAPLVAAIDSQREQLASQQSHCSTSYHSPYRYVTAVPDQFSGGDRYRFDAFYVPESWPERVRFTIVAEVRAWTDSNGNVDADDRLYLSLDPRNGSTVDGGDFARFQGSGLQTLVDENISAIELVYDGDGGEWIYFEVEAVANNSVGIKSIDSSNGVLDPPWWGYEQLVSSSGVEGRIEEWIVQPEITASLSDSLVGSKFQTNVFAARSDKPASIFLRTSQTPTFPTSNAQWPSNLQIELTYLDPPRMRIQAIDAELDLEYAGRQTPSRRRAHRPSIASDAVYQESVSYDEAPNARRSTEHVAAWNVRGREYQPDQITWGDHFDADQEPTLSALWSLDDNSHPVYRTGVPFHPELEAVEIECVCAGGLNRTLSKIVDDAQVEVPLEIRWTASVLGGPASASDSDTQTVTIRDQRFGNGPDDQTGDPVDPITHALAPTTEGDDGWSQREGHWVDRLERFASFNLEPEPQGVGDLLELSAELLFSGDAVGWLGIMAVNVIKVYQ